MTLPAEHPAARSARIRAAAIAEAKQRQAERFRATLADPAAAARWRENIARRRAETGRRLRARGVGAAELADAERSLADARARTAEWEL